MKNMKKLSTYLFLILFGFSAPSFADHLLKKSKEESLIFHKQRMNELPNNAHPIWNYKNEIIKKASGQSEKCTLEPYICFARS